MTDVYVYFRCGADDERTLAALRALQQEVEAATGIAGRIHVRRSDPPQRRTWMETYPDVPAGRLDGWLAELERLAARTGVAALALDGRHVELFEPIERCA